MKFRLLLALWVAFITYLFLTSQSIDSGSFRFEGSDKVGHFTSFFVGSVLLALSFKRIGIVKLFAFWAIYGLIIEVIQYYIPNRTFEWMDWVTDLIGVLGGYLVFQYFYHRKASN